MHVPPSFDGKSNVPVVIMLHGAGGSGAGAMGQTGWGAKSDREGFIAVFPDGTPPNRAAPAQFMTNPRLWNDGSGRGAISVDHVDDLGFISAMIDFLEARYAADPARIYCTGFSNGASMTFSVGLNLANRIAAIAPVSGHLWYSKKRLAYPVPLLFIIGTQDPLNPIDGGNVKLPWGKTRESSRRSRIRSRSGSGCSAADRKCKRRAATACSKSPTISAPKAARSSTTESGDSGHIWPGGTNRLPEKMVGKPSDSLNATDVIWDFFKAHPRLPALKPIAKND